MSKQTLTVVYLEELQEKFNTALNSVKEKEYLINLELKEIPPYLDYTPPQFSLMGGYVEKTNAIFKLNIQNYFINYRPLLKKAFNHISLYGEYKIDRNHQHKLTIEWEDKVIEQAYEFVNYYKWLNELKEKPKSTTQQKKSTLNIPIKLLSLHYLGLDLTSIENKKQTSKILKQILNEDGDENIRKRLSNIYAGKNRIVTKSNLESTAKLFLDNNLTDIYLKIKEDLDKLK